MENENINDEFENIVISDENVVEENTTNFTDENTVDTNSTENSNVVENTTNEVIENITEDETIANTIVDENVITIDNIHDDLIFISSIMIFFTVVLLLKVIFKFFDMFF